MLQRLFLGVALVLSIPAVCYSQNENAAKRAAVNKWHPQQVFVGANTKEDTTTGHSGPQKKAGTQQKQQQQQSGSSSQKNLNAPSSQHGATHR